MSREHVTCSKVDYVFPFSSETGGLVRDVALQTGKSDFFLTIDRFLLTHFLDISTTYTVKRLCRCFHTSLAVLYFPQSGICSITEAEYTHTHTHSFMHKVSPLKCVFLPADTGAAVLQGQEQVFPHSARETRRSGRLPPHHNVHQKGDSKKILFALTSSLSYCSQCQKHSF